MTEIPTISTHNNNYLGDAHIEYFSEDTIYNNKPFCTQRVGNEVITQLIHRYTRTYMNADIHTRMQTYTNTHRMWKL